MSAGSGTSSPNNIKAKKKKKSKNVITRKYETKKSKENKEKKELKNSKIEPIEPTEPEYPELLDGQVNKNQYKQEKYNGSSNDDEVELEKFKISAEKVDEIIEIISPV